MKNKILLVLSCFLLFGCTSSKITIVQSDKNYVYYEIFVGSFYDTNGDGLGDINGVTEKLNYIQSMGIGGLWLMPIMPSPTYHKYDVTNYYDIDPKYGTLDDFTKLVSRATSMDIDIIIDLVVNHTSVNHPWFVEAKKNILNGTCDLPESYCDYYNFTKEAKSGYSALGKGYFYEARFWSGMPDLNLESENVKNELKQIISFWLNKGVKGFRLDAVTSFFTGDVEKNRLFLSWLSQSIKEIKSDAYIVGEAWTTDDTIMSLYGSEIDSLFHFQFSQPEGKIASSIRNSAGSELATTVVSYLNNARIANPDVIDAIFLSNHDQGRSAAYFSEKDLYKSKLMASIYLLMPGRSFIYYGEEISLRGSGKDENKRLPMIWDIKDKTGQTIGPSGADYVWVYKAGVAQAIVDSNSLLSHYRRVISIKNSYDLITEGTVEALDVGSEIYAVKSSSATESIIVIHNLSETKKTLEYDFSDYKIADQIYNYKQSPAKISGGKLSVGAYNSVVLMLK
ncbi:MAG: alpha-amylase [Erysipelotrichaceae bacterium]|nr:alpha-amylase [Erysipelotrichaceae bacterium]